MNNEKFIRNTTIVSGVVGLAVDGIQQWIKIQNQEQEKFNFLQFFGNGLKGAAIGFGASITIVWLNSSFAPEELDEEDFEEVQYLKDVLASYNLDEIDKATLKKGLKIKNKIYEKFKYQLIGKPKFQGSIPQGTALSGISDLDIRLGFKNKGFATLQEMYETTLNFFKNEFCDNTLIEIRPQRKSIGLIFNILGEQVCIDVVPTRRTNSVRGANEYSIYENPTGLFGKPSRVKMNPYKQADFGSNGTAKAAVVSLMKILKEKEGYPFKSVFIKELTKRAFKSCNVRVPRRIDKQLVMTMEYVRDNLEYCRITAPDNSNNILSNSLTKNEKRIVADSLDYIVNDIKENPNNFPKYFPSRENL